MPIRCRCPACETQFRIDDKYAGKRARCPKCSQIVSVPQARKPEDDVPAFPSTGKAAGQEVATFPTVNSPKPAPDSPKPAPPRKPPVRAASDPSTGDTAKETVDLPAGFPMIDTSSDSSPRNPAAPSPVTSSTDTPAKSYQRKKRKSPLPIILGGSGAGLVVLIAVIFAIVSLSGGGGKSKQNAADGNSKSDLAVLVFDWPAGKRSHGSLTIDGQKKQLPAAGQIKFELKPGRHSLLIQRRGYEPIKETVVLKAGGELRRSPNWVANPNGIVLGGTQSNPGPSAKPAVSLPGYEGWWQDLDKAKEIAGKEKKDILIAFVGSDWNRESQILRQEVFASLQFQSIAERYVRVVIDTPRTETGFNQIADLAQNKWVKQDYGVVDSRIPLVVLADVEGRPYVVLDGYDDDGGQNYLRRLSTLHEEKAVRDNLLAHVNAETGEAKLDAALKAAEWIGENYVGSFFEDEIKQWLAIAQQFDPDNTKGKQEAFFELQWMTRLIKAKIEQDDQATKDIVAELDNWVRTRKLRDPNRGARMNLLAGMTTAETPADLQQRVDDALAYQPTDPSLKEDLTSLKAFAKRVASQVLGSGSGFVVGSSGYIMTNFHVVKHGGKPYVVLPGSEDGVPANVVAGDPDRDLALLKIDMPEGSSLEPLEVSAEEIGRGFDVAAFGYPLGGESLKATFGRISGLPAPSSEQMYVLDCTINPGNSGGPLCDKSGAVVGIVTAKTTNFQPGVDSYGMAVPAADIAKFLSTHLPDFHKGENAGRPKLDGWDQVDRLVSPSVLMVQLKGG